MLYRLLIAFLAALPTTVQPAFAQSPGLQGAEGSKMREQEWRIPAAGGSPLMIATVFRPPGDGRAPLAVINHGSDRKSTRLNSSH